MKLNINLLAPQRKEKLKFIRAAHLAMKVGFNGVFALLIFCVFLYFFLFALEKQTGVLQANWESLTKTESYQLIEKNKEMANEYSSYAEKLEKNFSADFFYWQVLDKIDSFLPENVFLKEVAIEGNKVTVYGRCVNREDFLIFKESLEKEATFSAVNSPISNFTSSQNVDFEISFLIKK